MLKILILACVAVWLLGFLRGKRKRLIRDSTHLLQFVLWFVMVFVGATMLPRAPYVEDSALLLGASVAVWFGASYYAARWLAARMGRG